MVSLAPVLTWVLHWYTAVLPWLAPGQHNADANTNVTVYDDAAAAREACAMLKARLPWLTYFPGSKEYDSANAHYYVSSTQNSTCAFLPSSPLHLASLMSVLHTTGAPFALKSGGHTANPGFSSTRGVQVSLARFTDFMYDREEGEVHIGAGLTWDEVYARLAPIGVTVAGGRIPGVGVAGFTLAGGYSWIANQVGMTRDTARAYHLVLPSGALLSATRVSAPELFYALQRGLNNFGILIGVTLRTYPQGPIWGGSMVYPNSSVPALIHAVAAWDRSSRTQEGDPKAQILAAFFSGEPTAALGLFYDAPTSPHSTFSVFSDIPHIYADVRTRTFLDFYTASYTPGGLRARSDTIPITHYTPRILSALRAQVAEITRAARAEGRSLVKALVIAEPFVLPPAPPSPFPFMFTNEENRRYTPCEMQVTWTSPVDDAFFAAALRRAADAVREVAVKGGKSRVDVPRYAGYAMDRDNVEGKDGVGVWGEGERRWLEHVRQRVDPGGVMRRAGGFKL